MDSPRKYNVERSCLRCHQRKVRCDKGTPCAACARQNLLCQYPGASRVRRRSARLASADIVARLEQLERRVAELSRRDTQPAEEEHTEHTEEPTERSAESAESAESTEKKQSLEKRGGVLVRDGRYINERFFSHFLENDKELQTVIATPSHDGRGIRRLSPLKLEGLITNPLLSHIDAQTLHPTRWQASQLWQTFLSRVDPLIKVLHIPSTQPRVFAAINHPQEAPADVHALVFAIYFAATTSMIPDNALREEFRTDLRRYQQGFEISLYQSAFLDAPTVTSLQAMAIYQISLRYHNSGRSSWMLHGLTIRAAQSIGLHHDGKHFNLPPLECEVRRRLWWHISIIDHRAAEDHGLAIVAQSEGCNTSLPSNVDDLDLSSTTAVAPQQSRWTEMTAPLIATEVNRKMLEISRRTTFDAVPAPEIARELKEYLQEKYLQYGDLNIPIQRHGMLLADVLAIKVAVYARQKALQIGSQTQEQTQQHSQEQSQEHETLEMACHALEIGLDMQTDELLGGFRWLATTYTQYHLLTYVLWHLCTHPTGPHVARAWSCIDAIFQPVETDPSWPDPGPKWAMVLQMRAKATRIREVSCSPTESTEQLLHDGSSLEAFLDPASWDVNMLGFSEWSTLLI